MSPFVVHAIVCTHDLVAVCVALRQRQSGSESRRVKQPQERSRGEGVLYLLVHEARQGRWRQAGRAGKARQIEARLLHKVVNEAARDGLRIIHSRNYAPCGLRGPCAKLLLTELQLCE